MRRYQGKESNLHELQSLSDSHGACRPDRDARTLITCAELSQCARAELIGHARSHDVRPNGYYTSDGNTKSMSSQEHPSRSIFTTIRHVAETAWRDRPSFKTEINVVKGWRAHVSANVGTRIYLGGYVREVLPRVRNLSAARKVRQHSRACREFAGPKGPSSRSARARLLYSVSHFELDDLNARSR